MSGFGNFIAGAVGGGGAAVASISSKYIDDEITRSRAQALADIQRNSAVQQTKELDAYQNSPERRAAQRRESDLDADATNAAALRGRIAEAGNADLQDANLANLRRQKSVEGEVAAQQLKTNASDPEYLKGVRAVKLADPEVPARLDQVRAAIGESGARSRMLGIQAEGARMDLDARKKVESLLDQYDETLNDKSLDDKARGAKLTQLTQQLNVVRAKTGKAGGSDETDTVKVTEEEMLPGGGTRKTERTEKRKAGGSNTTSPAPAPGASGRPWEKFGGSGAGQPAAQGGPAAAPAATPSTASTRPAPDSMTAGIEGELAPLVSQYRQAEQYFQGAARSGDPNAVAVWQAQLLEAKRRLLAQANARLGNGAESFLARNGVN